MELLLYWLTWAAAELSLLCLLLVLCTGWSQCLGREEAESHQNCLFDQLDIRFVQAEQCWYLVSSELLTFSVDSAVTDWFSFCQSGTGTKNNILCHQAEHHHLKALWVQMKGSRSVDVLRQQTTTPWEEMHRDYKHSPGACSIIPLISRTGVTVGSGLTQNQPIKQDHLRIQINLFLCGNTIFFKDYFLFLHGALCPTVCLSASLLW